MERSRIFLVSEMLVVSADIDRSVLALRGVPAAFAGAPEGFRGTCPLDPREKDVNSRTAGGRVKRKPEPETGSWSSSVEPGGRVAEPGRGLAGARSRAR